ncbi:MAG: class I SAM-dependent methyltransferase, partial [Alphaproteobacteria bacterium]
DRYIFPNGHLPSGREILNAAEPYFTVEDWHSFGPDYDKTVMAWIENFEASYPDLDHSIYDERFRRMWIFYLAPAAAGFRLRINQLWQVLLGQGDRTDIPVWR